MTPLPDEPDALAAEAARLLWRDNRANRLAAAQLLARGYAILEERRLEARPEGARRTALQLLSDPVEE